MFKNYLSKQRKLLGLMKRLWCDLFDRIQKSPWHFNPLTLQRKLLGLMKRLWWDLFYRIQKSPRRFNPLTLIILNILRPARILSRLKRDPKPNLHLTITKDIPKTLLVEVKGLNDDKAIFHAKNLLKKYGAVVISGLIKDSEIEIFCEVYKDVIDKIKRSEEHACWSGPLLLTESLIRIWLNNISINILQKILFGKMLYARNYPQLFYHNGSSKAKKMLPHSWHIDHNTIANVCVFLHDIQHDQSLMQVLPGTHSLPLLSGMNFNLSKGERKNYKRIHEISLTGPKGSIQIHDGNIIHRAYVAKNSERLWFQNEFCCGKNILMQPSAIAQCIGNNYNLNQLKIKERKILAGIFPLTPFKGYNIMGSPTSEMGKKGASLIPSNKNLI